jgi:hypothetical protein
MLGGSREEQTTNDDAGPDASDGPVLEIRLQGTEPVSLELTEGRARHIDPRPDRAFVIEIDQRVLNLGHGSTLSRLGLLLRLIVSRRIRMRRLFTAGPGVALWMFRHRHLLGRVARS